MAPQPSTEQNFRANLSQFRWARGNTDDSQQAQVNQPLSNSFSRFYNAVGGAYIPLRSSEQSNEDQAYFALSRWERCVASSDHGLWQLDGDRLTVGMCARLIGFLGCLAGAAVCFAVAFFTLPLLALRPAKFALAFRYDSLFLDTVRKLIKNGYIVWGVC